MNRELLDKFVKLEREIAKEKGALSLFVILLREELGQPCLNKQRTFNNEWNSVLDRPLGPGCFRPMDLPEQEG